MVCVVENFAVTQNHSSSFELIPFSIGVWMFLLVFHTTSLSCTVSEIFTSNNSVAYWLEVVLSNWNLHQTIDRIPVTIRLSLLRLQDKARFVENHDFFTPPFYITTPTWAKWLRIFLFCFFHNRARSLLNQVWYRHSATRRALGRAQLPPTKVCRRLSE